MRLRTRWGWLALGLALAGAGGAWRWQAGDGSASSGGHVPPVAGGMGREDHLRAPRKPSPLPGRAMPSAMDWEVQETAVAPAPLPVVAVPAVKGAPANPTVSDADAWAHYSPTREELEYRAFKAEQEATKELQNLLQVLDLDELAQDRVFAALVRSSDYYHPSLQPQGVGGLAIGPSPVTNTTPAGPAAPGAEVGGFEAAPGAGTPEAVAADAPFTADPVLAELTPEQADVYERYTSERDAFWVGVVEDIEKELKAMP